MAMVSGIKCNQCDKVLPPHTETEHLDINNPIHKCPHNNKMSRQCLKAYYHIEEKFKIPKGIDLKNEEQVKDWGIKWNVLHILLKNGKELEIPSSWDKPNDYDWKRPDDIEFQDESDDEYDDESDQECAKKEKEDDGQDCRRCGSFIKDGDEFVPPESTKAYCKNCVEKYDDVQAECFPVDECRCDTCGDCIGDSKNKCDHDRFCYCEEKEEPAQEDNLKSIVVGKVKKTRKLRK